MPDPGVFERHHARRGAAARGAARRGAALALNSATLLVQRISALRSSGERRGGGVSTAARTSGVSALRSLDWCSLSTAS